MFHVDNNSAVPVMPAVKPVVSAATSYFTEGGNGVPPTYPGPDWFNIVQSELLAILAAAGFNPDKANNAQLLAAMKLLFLDASQNGADIQDKTAFLQNLGFSYSNNLYKFPGRQMTQRGSSITNAAGATTITFPQAFSGNVVVLLTGSDSNGVTLTTLNGLPTNTGFSVTTKIAGGAYVPLNFSWIAWGDY